MSRHALAPPAILLVMLRAIAFAPGTWTFVAFLVAFFFAVAHGYYSRGTR